jgi:hypothetical protein
MDRAARKIELESVLLGEALEPAAVLAGLLVIGSAAVGRGLRTASASPGVA